MSNVLIFGATGATGLRAVHQALAAGHRVTAFVRNPAKLPSHPSLRTVIGDLDDADAVAGAIAGQDAVVCTLGAPASSRDGVRARGTRQIVAGMTAAGVRRLVVLSVYGLGAQAAKLPWFVRNLVIPFYLARAFADHAAQEEIVRGSGLDWTLVQPPFLVEGTGVVHTDDEGPRKWKISHDDVAKVLVARAEDQAWLHEARLVTW